MEKTIGERIQWIIQSLAGKSTAEFAMEIEVSVPTVNAWIAGNSDPSFKSLVSICQKYSINPEWILLGTGEPTGGATLPFIRPIIDMVRIEPAAMGIFMLCFDKAVNDVRRLWPHKFGQIIGEI